MAINGVKVSLPDMMGAKGKLSSDGTDIMNQLGRVKSSMDYLKGTEVWSSEGATEIQRKFENLYPRFAEMKRVIDDYVAKLDDTIRKYDVTESAVVQDTKSVNDWA